MPAHAASAPSRKLGVTTEPYRSRVGTRAKNASRGWGVIEVWQPPPRSGSRECRRSLCQSLRQSSWMPRGLLAYVEGIVGCYLEPSSHRQRSSPNDGMHRSVTLIWTDDGNGGDGRWLAWQHDIPRTEDSNNCGCDPPVTSSITSPWSRPDLPLKDFFTEFGAHIASLPRHFVQLILYIQMARYGLWPYAAHEGLFPFLYPNTVLRPKPTLYPYRNTS